MWYKRYKSEGHYLARKVGGQKSKIRSEDIVLYVNASPKFTLLEMGKHFNMSGVGTFYWLKKLGYSYKKKTSHTWRLKKNREITIKKL